MKALVHLIHEDGFYRIIEVVAISESDEVLDKIAPAVKITDEEEETVIKIDLPMNTQFDIHEQVDKVTDFFSKYDRRYI